MVKQQSGCHPPTAMPRFRQHDILLPVARKQPDAAGQRSPGSAVRLVTSTEDGRSGHGQVYPERAAWPQCGRLHWAHCWLARNCSRDLRSRTAPPDRLGASSSAAGIGRRTNERGPATARRPSPATRPWAEKGPALPTSRQSPEGIDVKDFTASRTRPACVSQRPSALLAGVSRWIQPLRLPGKAGPRSGA